MLKRYNLDLKTLGLIIVGSLSWVLTMVKSGLVYPFGMGFWGPNGHDGVWHIALANSLAKGSWEMPVFAGEKIKNYHIGFDLILAFIHRLTLIPISSLYFQVLPPILAFLIGFFTFEFVYAWQNDKAKAYWATFFVYFAGGWGWVVTLLKNGEISGESIFWSQQSTSTLVNPPFALSLIFLFAGLYFLVEGLLPGYAKRKNMLLATFLFGLLIQIKVYAGILVLIGLLIAGLWRLIKREGLDLVKVFTGSLIIAILVSSPLSKGFDQTVVFEPFWFLESMVSSPDRFYWPKMASAIANYKLSNNLFKLALAYALTFVIFCFGNLGVRIIKEPLFIRHLKNLRKISYNDVFAYSVIGAGVLIPTFFIQEGTPWNTIQFFYYALVFSGVFAGISFVELLRKFNLGRLMNFAIEGLLLFLVIPSVYSTLRNYIPARPPAMISKNELEALSFLSKLPDGVVLTLPFDKEASLVAQVTTPRPLYLYESTAYVSAFSEKSTFLEDEVNLEITRYGWRERKKRVEEFINTSDIEASVRFLKDNNIKYIYWVKGLSGNFAKDSILSKLFENSEVQIFSFEN